MQLNTSNVGLESTKVRANLTEHYIFFWYSFKILCNMMLYMSLQYGWEPVQRILIGFQAIPEKYYIISSYFLYIFFVQTIKNVLITGSNCIIKYYNVNSYKIRLFSIHAKITYFYMGVFFFLFPIFLIFHLFIRLAHSI